MSALWALLSHVFFKSREHRAQDTVHYVCATRTRRRLLQGLHTVNAGMVQGSATTRRSSAEAALESILHLCRWSCEPLQAAFTSQQEAEENASKMLNLLCTPAVDGGSGSSWCASAVAAAGAQQGQRCASGLASVLNAAAGREASAAAAPRLAAVARLLRCMCSGSGSWPVAVRCLRSRQGQRLLRTRVAAPVAALNAAAGWLADGGRLSRLQHTQVHNECSNHEMC